MVLRRCTVQINKPTKPESDPYGIYPSSAALGYGTKQFSVTLIRAATSQIVVEDVDGAGELYEQNISPEVTTVPGSPTKLQILVPNETPVQGSGKTGAVQNQTAGLGYTVTVRACDNNWNLVITTAPTVSVTSNDSYAQIETAHALTQGATTFAVSLRRRTIVGVDPDRNLTAEYSGTMSPQTSGNFVVASSAPVKLQLLVRVFPLLTAMFQITAEPSSQMTAGLTYTATVNLTDPYWNKIIRLVRHNGPNNLGHAITISRQIII